MDGSTTINLLLLIVTAVGAAFTGWQAFLARKVVAMPRRPIGAQESTRRTRLLLRRALRTQRRRLRLSKVEARTPRNDRSKF